MLMTVNNMQAHLFELAVPVGFDAIWRMQLNGGTADHLDTALLILSGRWAHTAVDLDHMPTKQKMQTPPEDTFRNQVQKEMG